MVGYGRCTSLSLTRPDGQEPVLCLIRPDGRVMDVFLNREQRLSERLPLIFTSTPGHVHVHLPPSPSSGSQL